MIDRLHYISQERDGLSHLQAIENALEAGCKWIQLRVKKQPESKVKELAIRAKELCSAYSAKLIVNDFPQIAKEIEADGVHLGLQDIPLREARALSAEELLLGGTANTLENIKLRILEGADYVGLGPYRFTTTKENLSPILGLEGYQSIMQQMKQEGLTIPVIAIGGIRLEDVEDLMQAGVYGVAVSGTITASLEPGAVVKELYKKLEEGVMSYEL